MYDIEHLNNGGLNVTKHENAVFDACRANPQRENKGPVSFMLLASGDYQAALRNEEGIVVLLCKVDEFDC